MADAIRAGRDAELATELGDLLLNVAFQIVLAEERGAFDGEAVVGLLEEKMRDRHPHIYGDAEEAPDWEELKAHRKAADVAAHDASVAGGDPFDGLPSGLEPLSRALRMQDRAAGWNFDWPDAKGAVDKLREEIGEVEVLLSDVAGSMAGDRNGPDEAALEEELGDLLFSAVNVCRLAGVHPSNALEHAAAKFGGRFRRVLELASQEGIEPRETSLDELNRLWETAKAENDGDG